ncbi:MAG: sigma-54-dependent Fis family transcriptional regulator [Ignavibacteriaceae bacterium]|nr:sigma-54-dependent Fis family transcriptional regulator [Ignavibacteriaceae bacterium]
MAKILLIDDEIDICNTMSMILEFEGYGVRFFTNPTEGYDEALSNLYDLIILDISMPGLNGLELLKRLNEAHVTSTVMFMTAHGSIENAVKATRLGAFDFLEKPVDREKLLISVRNAVDQSKLRKNISELESHADIDESIVGNSSKIKEILSLIERVAPTDVRVLISGENGTGKELVARAIHKNSTRNNKPFVEVNCAAIPNELIESELFGHEKGAFTGAMQQRAGKFELADTGTLFLDEIGDMSLQAQAKVLRAIEDGKIERVGGSKKIDVDVRIVSATNKNLIEMIKSGEFREDLFHRLNVIPVTVPPLRERPGDIPLLIKHFSVLISKKYKRKEPEFSSDAISLLQKLKWTGNIRELKNIIERVIILVNKPVINYHDIEFLVPSEKFTFDEMIEESNSFQDFKDKAEKAYIIKQLELHNWNVSKTAESLDIQRSHLYNKIKKFGLDREDING